MTRQRKGGEEEEEEREERRRGRRGMAGKPKLDAKRALKAD